MSLDATKWAWVADVDSGSQRLVLLSLADRAGEEHTCYPSLQRLIKDTKLNRKTIIAVLDDLELKHLIKFTGQTKGKGVKVYKLIGVLGREDDVPTSTEIGTSAKKGTGSVIGTDSNNGTSTNNGTDTSTNIGMGTSTNIGTQNLPMNLSLESKNKKHWLCSKKLSDEIAQANPNLNPNDIISATWFNREFRAFEIFNAGKNLCDDLMIYHFANWLLEAKGKYDRLNSTPQPNTKQGSKPTTGMSDKQAKLFASKLANLQTFGSQYAEGTETHEQLAYRITPLLKQHKYLEEWKDYLIEVGYGQNGAAA